MYKHGTYGELVPTSITPEAAASCVVYVGTAPAHKIKGQSERADLFNLPLRITNVESARKLLGYSEQAPFEKYTLCEAIEIHFKNAIENIGPIYCINVLDPNLDWNYEEIDEGIELTVLKKQAKFVLGDLMLDSIQIEELKKSTSEEVATEQSEEETSETPSVDESFTTELLIEDQDYSLIYDSVTDTVTLTFLNTEVPTKVLVKGKIINPDVISASEIIGGITPEGKKTGLQAVLDMHRKHNEITNLIAAPGFSEIPEVYEAMCRVVEKLNGHWDAFAVVDVPIKDGEARINTRVKALQWKEDHGYTSGRTVPLWPQVKRKGGKFAHLSTMITAVMQVLDTAAGGVPYQSPSNHVIDIEDLYAGEGFAGFDQYEANELNEGGITTAIRWGGKWRLWGGHTGAYSYKAEEAGASFDPTTRFITSIRTMMHITNSFQKDNFDLIDQPMTPALKDFILQKEQSKLDAMVATGALLGQPKIRFSEDNSPEQIMGGNFVWDIEATTGVPFKSGTVRLGYTDAGVYTLIGEEE